MLTTIALKPGSALGRKLFEWRDYTPIPLIVIHLIFADPTALSATLGLLSMLIGELIRIYSVAFIGSISRTRSDNLGAKLVSTGPFAYVRNPLYVGNFFITLGVSIFAGIAPLVALTVAAFAFQYTFIVKHEEHLLEQRFGQDYIQYCQNVPPWFPRQFPNLGQLEQPDEYAKALRSERRTLTAIVAVSLVLAVRGLF